MAPTKKKIVHGYTRMNTDKRGQIDPPADNLPRIVIRVYPCSSVDHFSSLFCSEPQESGR
jgi:hypothetical protein